MKKSSELNAFLSQKNDAIFHILIRLRFQGYPSKPVSLNAGLFKNYASSPFTDAVFVVISFDLCKAESLGGWLMSN